jgi:SAM-dependent methyltransferase
MTSSSLRSIAKRLTPKPILRMYRQIYGERLRQQYGSLSVAEAFSQTYRTKLWGQIEGEEFCSGGGSLEEFAIPYTSWVARFIADHKIKTVVDLGCGDFRIGQRICSASLVNYVGVDIVPDLIAYNNSRFESKRITFKCANIIEDELPSGDLCLIRQVLQHLSNKQISRILVNCAKFPHLLITEHVYNGPNMRPNLDIMHGPDNRLFRRSGVVLDRPPFNMRAQNVLEIPCSETSSIIQTRLIEANTPVTSGSTGAYS